MDQRQLSSPNAPLWGSLPPKYAGFLRGLLAAVIVAAIEAAAHYLQAGPNLPSSWAIYLPIVVALLRTLEGVIDHHSVTQPAAVAPTTPPTDPGASAPPAA